MTKKTKWAIAIMAGISATLIVIGIVFAFKTPSTPKATEWKVDRQDPNKLIRHDGEYVNFSNHDFETTRNDSIDY